MSDLIIKRNASQLLSRYEREFAEILEKNAYRKAISAGRSEVTRDDVRDAVSDTLSMWREKASLMESAAS